MIHRGMIQLLTQIKHSNYIIYVLILFLLAYLLLGISAGILFIAAINLKEICILAPTVKLKEKLYGAIGVIFVWPVALFTMYELWYNFCMYLSCLFAGSTFRGKLMNDKNVVQLRHIVMNSKGEVSFKKLATVSMGCVEELIVGDEHNGDTFVTIYGLEEKPKSQIVPHGVSFCSSTTLDFLKELKENGLMGLQRVEAEKEIKFDFNDTKLENFNMVFPEDVFCYVFEDINTVYVTKATEIDDDSVSDSNLMEFKDQLYNEVHINSNSILFMIDYSNHEAYALDHEMNEIMNCEYEGNDPEDHFTRVRVGDTILKYVYNSIGYLDRIDIDKTDEDNDYGYYLKIDERDETNRKREHITITYMVPYLKDTGNVFVYSKDCRIYRTDTIYLERDKVLEWETSYRILTDVEEADLNDAFSKTLENSNYIIK